MKPKDQQTMITYQKLFGAALVGGAMALASVSASALTLSVDNLDVAGPAEAIIVDGENPAVTGTIADDDEAGAATADGLVQLEFAEYLSVVPGSLFSNVTAEGEGEPRFTFDPGTQGLFLNGSASGGTANGGVGTIEFLLVDELTSSFDGPVNFDTEHTANLNGGSVATATTTLILEGADGVLGTADDVEIVLLDSDGDGDAFVTIALSLGEEFILEHRFTLSNPKFGEGDVDLSTVLTPVPVPAALPLFASAMIGLGLLGRRRKRS